LIEGVGRKGNKPPPHIHHREDETFYILEGEMTATVGGEKIEGKPGSVICSELILKACTIQRGAKMRMLVADAGRAGRIFQGVQCAGGCDDDAATGGSPIRRHAKAAGHFDFAIMGQ
jgi:hypothetical protein